MSGRNITAKQTGRAIKRGGHVEHIIRHKKRKGSVIRAGAQTERVPTPPGYQTGQKIYSVRFNDAEDHAHLRKFGVRFGDHLVAVATADIQPRDLAVIFEACGGSHVGQYFTAPGNRFKFEGEDGAQVLKRDEVKIAARVVGVIRAGKYVEIDLPIRPLAQDVDGLEWPEVIGELGGAK